MVAADGGSNARPVARARATIIAAAAAASALSLMMLMRRLRLLLPPSPLLLRQAITTVHFQSSIQAAVAVAAARVCRC